MQVLLRRLIIRDLRIVFTNMVPKPDTGAVIESKPETKVTEQDIKACDTLDLEPRQNSLTQPLKWSRARSSSLDRRSSSSNWLRKQGSKVSNEESSEKLRPLPRTGRSTSGANYTNLKNGCNNQTNPSNTSQQTETACY